jgi:ferric-dicitrate binding protein FerR (iron transport regulator)
MEYDQEIVELLREIRDLHKAHCQEWKAFTERMTQQNLATREQDEKYRAEIRATRKRPFGVFGFIGVLVTALAVFYLLQYLGDVTMHLGERLH